MRPVVVRALHRSVVGVRAPVHAAGRRAAHGARARWPLAPRAARSRPGGRSLGGRGPGVFRVHTPRERRQAGRGHGSVARRAAARERVDRSAGLRRWRHWSQRGRARACALCWRGGWAAGACPPGWRRFVRAALAWRQSALPCSGRWGWAKRCGPSCGQKNPAGSGRKARRIGIVLDTGGRIEYNTMDIMAEQAHGALAPAAGNAGKNGCGQIPPRCKRGFL